MLRIFRLILMVALFSSTQSFGSTNAVEAEHVTLSPQEREWINQHPVMRVGVLTKWAPFCYYGPDGQLNGVDVDLLNIISERTGLKFELKPHDSWDQLVADWDHLDMVSSVVQSPMREKVADFTREYSTSPLVIVEREGEEVFGPLAVLRHRRLALPRTHIVTQLVTNRIPELPLILGDTQDECFQLVAKQKADATIVNLFVASQYLNNHPEGKLSISGVLVKPQLPLRMAVHRDTNHVVAVSIVNKGLASISQQEMDVIFARHLLFGLQSRRRVGLMEKRVKQVATGAAVAGLLLLSWNLFLRKEIRARRKAEAELREANESINIFAHSLSHDLRAPLRGMTGLAQALKADHYEKLNSEGQDYLDHVIASGSRMDKMMVDVLAHIRTTSSEWPMGIVELDPLIRELIGDFPLGQRQYFRIVSQLPPVRGNATLLTQCLENLLSNAVMYVPKDRTPHVEISATQEGATVTVSVEDNGIGVAPKDQKRIFEIFQRAAPAHYKGTGIGLAVVAKAAERMGGSVGVESQVGQGSRFWIRLPAGEPEQSVHRARPTQPFWRRFAFSRGT